MNMETLLKQTTSFRDDLLKDLADMEFAMYYLEAALSDYKEDGNTEALWTALCDVVAAQGGIENSLKGQRLILSISTIYSSLNRNRAWIICKTFFLDSDFRFAWNSPKTNRNTRNPPQKHWAFDYPISLSNSS